MGFIPVGTGIKNTDAEIRDAILNDATRFAGANIDAVISGIPTTPTLQATWTDAKAAFLDEAISAAKTLTVAERTAIRQSVCLTGDPANSIGKALYEIYVTRLTAARAGYLPILNTNSKYLVTDDIMESVSPVGAGTIAEYIRYTREQIRGHNQTRIGLIIPDLSNKT